MISCIVLGLVSCLWTLIEDVRSREIHIFPLLLFILSGIGFHYFKDEAGFWQTIGTNILILGFIFFSILLIYRLKGEKKVLGHKVGWGDWVFLLGLGSWLETEVFIFFYAVSTILITLGFFILRYLRNLPATYPIPLAGLLAICFALFFPIYHFGILIR